LPKRSSRKLTPWQKGWRTRRTNARKRSEAAKKGWRTRRRKQRERKSENIDHLVSVEIKTRERKNGRNRDHSFKRDIVVPAPPGTSQRVLLEIANRTLPRNEQYAIRWTRVKGAKITVAEGPRSRARKAKLR
jgi:hypothetical protein